MCGIAGIIGSRASVETVNAMTQRLRHRGPDGEGVWSEPGVVFGHRRLAILDLSQGGDQPMVLGAHVLTYNGEIYNHQALRAALPGPWRSSGDTEVLLHLLARRGSACLEQLVGMFAFAIWDAGSRRCCSRATGSASSPSTTGSCRTASRLPRSSKPCWCSASRRSIAGAVRDYLFHGYVPAPKTIYRGIAKLPAGHTLTWQDGRVHIERYWRPSTAVEPRTASDTLHELDELLREVVPAHTLSDVPVGVFLSGGIDSALTTYYLDAPRTYSSRLRCAGPLRTRGRARARQRT